MNVNSLSLSPQLSESFLDQLNFGSTLNPIHWATVDGSALLPFLHLQAQSPIFKRVHEYSRYIPNPFVFPLTWLPSTLHTIASSIPSMGFKYKLLPEAIRRATAICFQPYLLGYHG